MDSDTNAQDNTNVTNEVPTAPVVDDQSSEEITADTLAPVAEEAVETPQAGDVIEPTEPVEPVEEPADVAEEVKPETVPHEACRGTGLEQGLPDATKLCAGCEGSGVVKVEG